jgi:DNA repair exonuclease SbcCD ATPase subunit
MHNTTTAHDPNRVEESKEKQAEEREERKEESFVDSVCDKVADKLSALLQSKEAADNLSRDIVLTICKEILPKVGEGIQLLVTRVASLEAELEKYKALSAKLTSVCSYLQDRTQHALQTQQSHLLDYKDELQGCEKELAKLEEYITSTSLVKLSSRLTVLEASISSISPPPWSLPLPRNHKVENPHFLGTPPSSK